MSSDLSFFALGGLLYLASLAGVHEIGYHRGSTAEANAALARESGTSALHERAINLANARERNTEHALGEQLRKQINHHHEEIQREKDAHARYVAGLRAGTIRLSVPVVARTEHASCGATARTVPTAAGPAPETRAELGAEAAIDLATIAADGDAAIRDLNACVDTYNAVRERLNGPPGTRQSTAEAGGHVQAQ